MSQRSENIKKVIETADNYVGFRSFANKVNGFGAAARQDGQAWAGSFLDKVFDEAGVRVPSLVSTVSALAYYTRENSIYRSPQVGDLVFYSFSTDHHLGQPHIGLVTDVSEWKARGAFRATEGQVSSGLPKGPQESDGVYTRTRYSTDVIGFARPAYRTATVVPDTSPSHLPLIRLAEVQKSGVYVSVLQLALARVTAGANFNRGKLDAQTRSAIAQFQREHAIFKNGELDQATLDLLAHVSRVFRTV